MRKYIYEGRNGYGAVDLYVDGICHSLVYMHKSKHAAQEVSALLNSAYNAGLADADTLRKKREDLRGPVRCPSCTRMVSRNIDGKLRRHRVTSRKASFYCNGGKA